MALTKDLKDATPDNENQTVGKSSCRVDTNLVNQLKQETGATQVNQINPLIEAAVAEYVNEDGDEYEDEFKAQFEDDE